MMLTAPYPKFYLSVPAEFGISRGTSATASNQETRLVGILDFKLWQKWDEIWAKNTKATNFGVTKHLLAHAQSCDCNFIMELSRV